MWSQVPTVKVECFGAHWMYFIYFGASYKYDKLVDISFNKKHHSWIIIGFILGITWSTEVGKYRKDVTEGSMYLICFLKHQNFIVIYQILKMHSFKDRGASRASKASIFLFSHEEHYSINLPK